MNLAATLAGAAEHLRASINYNVEPAERRFRNAYLATLYKAISKEDFDRSYEQGRKLRLDDCVALALGEQISQQRFDLVELLTPRNLG